MKNTNTEEPMPNDHFIIDVNIIFSGVLSRKDIYRKLFSECKLYTPDFAFIELNKYRDTILKRTSKISAKELREFTLFLFSKITVVPDYLVSKESFRTAEKLVESIDKKDVAYIALVQELGYPLLTRDKKLHDGLKAQGFDKIILFDRFVTEMAASIK